MFMFITSCNSEDLNFMNKSYIIVQFYALAVHVYYLTHFSHSGRYRKKRLTIKYFKERDANDFTAH